MKKPVRPQKILSSVAMYISAPGAAPKTPNPKHAINWKECQKKNKANKKKFEEDMRAWRLYEKERKETRERVKAIKKKVLANKHPRSGIPAGVKMEGVGEMQEMKEMEEMEEMEEMKEDGAQP
jgi:hypothetical protein